MPIMLARSTSPYLYKGFTMWDSLKPSRRQFVALASAFAVASAAAHSFATTTTSTWTGTTSTVWSNAANWSPNTADPSNGNNGVSDYDVIIGTPSPTILDINATIDSLTVNAGGLLQSNGGESLTINGPTLTNNGTILINTNLANAVTSLGFAANTTLTGTGTLSLNDNGNPVVAQIVTAANVTLTQDVNHTINGHGGLDAALINNGTVNASVANTTLLLQSNPMTNNNLFEATAGTLSISSITVTQGLAGQISAAGGTVNITNSTVSGGTLASSSAGVIQITGSSTLTSLTNTSNALDILAGASVTANGNIVDNGTITVNNGTVNAVTSLTFTGGTLSGNGTLFLNDNANPVCAQLNGTLTQAAGHTIIGHGEINAALTNNGIVNAAGGNLTLQSNPMTNNNLFEATTGTLNISSITVTQGAANQILAANGTVNIISSTISGGILNTSGTGLIQASGTTTLAGITNSGKINIVPNASVSATGNIVDNGLITINDGNTNALDSITFTGGVLSGNGTLFLNDNTNPVCAQLNGTLTQAAGHTITGHGEINATFINNGVVNANGTGLTLNILSPTLTNTNLIEATNGATVSFAAGVVVTDTGANITANGGNISISGNAVITGGTLTSIGSSTFTTNSATFNAVTLATGTQVNVAASSTLTLNGPIVTNNGPITVNPTGVIAVTSLTIGSNLSLVGSGTVTLIDGGNPNAARLDFAANVTLTNNQTINGHGNINENTGSLIVNNSVINANVASTTLNVNGPVTNNNIMEATAGNLSINGTAITQASGAQVAAAGGTVILVNSSITNGTLNSSGNGTFQISGGGTIASLTNNAPIFIPGGTALTANGNIVNNGNITINTTAAVAQTALTVTDGILSGTGTVILNAGGVGNAARLDGNLTQAAGHSIVGDGNINAALTNNGTVNSNVAGLTLNLNGPVTNNNLIEATLGNLAINGVTITQAPTAQITASPGSVTLAGATIVNGILNSSTTGTYQVSGGATISSLTNNAPIFIPGGALLTANGDIVDNGSITINTTAAVAQTSLTVNGGTVSGTGTFILNDGSVGNAARIDGNFTQAAGHTITGDGNINATLINNGTILSNLTGNSINVNGPITNNGLIRATNGASIAFGAGTIVSNGTLSGTGTFQVDANSSMSIASPGPFASAATIILTGPNATFTGLSSLASNTGNLTLRNGATTTITGPITNAGTIFLNGSNNTLTVSGGFTNTTGALNGNGTLIAGALFGNITVGSLSVQVPVNGTNAATSKLTSLTLAGTTNNWTNALALNNNKLILETSNATKANALTTLRNQIFFGLTHPTGITTSNIPANFGIAVADNNALSTPFTTFGGQPVDTNSLLVSPELLGDADLSGHVDLTDLSTVLNNFGSITPAWTSGNFDNTSTINLTDLSDVLNNFGASNPNANTSPSRALPTPEPASLALLIPALILVRKRRFRSEF